MRSNPSMHYSPALDGLRAVAVVMVLLFHANAPFALGGFVGVDVFFVLSGFLITRLLAQEYEARARIDLLAFFRKRLVRLMPALLVMLAAVLLFAPLFWPGESQLLLQAVVAALYMSDFGVAFYLFPPRFDHTWSLSVEMHFYLLWPLVLLALLRHSRRPHLVAFSLYLLATVWRFKSAYHLPFMEAYARFDTRIPGLLLGSWLALLLRQDANLIPRLLSRASLPLWMLIGAACIFALRFDKALSLGLGVIGMEWCTAALIVASESHGRLKSALTVAPLLSLGRLSYGVYLWHVPVFDAIGALPWWQMLVIGLPPSFALAWLSSVTVERWAQRFRTRQSSPGLKPATSSQSMG